MKILPYHNFFLTGEMRVGKTTVLKKVLQELSDLNLQIHGFQTTPIIEHGNKTGYAIDNFRGQSRVFAHVNLRSQFTFGPYKVNPSVFDSFGCNTLSYAHKHADLIIMDELGCMESDADKFKDLIILCLDSEKPVLGAYQKRAQWFAKLIENRTDIKVYEINVNNINSPVRKAPLFKLIEIFISVSFG